MDKSFLSRIGIRFHKGNPGWYYIAFGRFEPFKFLNHSGWIFMNISWLKRFGFDRPKKRGWRFD